MRASSFFSFEEGIGTTSFDACAPLRTRVRKSAMGSVIDMRSPRALGHAREVAVVREVAQADAAQPELAEHGARPATTAAARVSAGSVLGGPLLADTQ